MTQPKTKQILDIKDDPSLKEAQAFVGGYVEMVRLDDGILLVDEEGKLKRFRLIILHQLCMRKHMEEMQTLSMAMPSIYLTH